MIAAKATGWPSPKRGPARSPERTPINAIAAGGIAVGAALLAIAPLASLVVIAAGSHRRPLAPSDPLRRAGGAGADRAAAPRRRRGHHRHRRRHRLGSDHVPVSRARHARLDAGAAARNSDLHRGLRLCRPARRLRPGAIGAARAVRLAGRRRLLVPERALAARRDPADGLRALSLCLSRRARDVSDPGGAVCGGRARARRTAVPAGAADLAAAGAARDRGRRRARAARNAQRHRPERISRRADADAVDLHHLAQPRQPCRRGADRLRDAGVRRRADRARTLRTARPRASPR